jgi:hypothetical protein
MTPRLSRTVQGLIDDRAGEAFRGVDAEEQGWRAAVGRPGISLGRELRKPPVWRRDSRRPSSCGLVRVRRPARNRYPGWSFARPVTGARKPR